jgi:hypothetical protein
MFSQLHWMARQANMLVIARTYIETLMTTEVDTKFRREPKRGSHDYKLACEFLDAGKICHVGFTLDDQPYVVRAYG